MNKENRISKTEYESIEQLSQKHPLVLFDGVCNFCNSFVQFVIKRDPDAIFRFASLQSETGELVSKHFKLKTEDYDTFILLQDGKIFQKSTAALKLVKMLKSPLRIFSVLIVIPRFIRDGLYSLIAKHRYKIFGRKDQCPLPEPGTEKRFI